MSCICVNLSYWIYYSGLYICKLNFFTYSYLTLQVLQPPAGYIPIRTPARKLTATPTPMIGGTPTGFRMQGTPEHKAGANQVVDLQPKGKYHFVAYICELYKSDCNTNAGRLPFLVR